MAALVQTIPQQSSAVPVLQTRPSSSSGAFTTSQSLQQSNSRNQAAMSWNTYNAAGNSGGYRQGHQVVAPYAFTTTPNLSNSSNAQNRQSWSPSLRPEHRTSSAPSAPQVSANAAHVGVSASRPVHHIAAGSVSTSSSNSSSQSYMSKDDTAIPSRKLRTDPSVRPLSTANLPSPTPPFMNISSPTVSRPSPDRYRRGNRRSDSPSTAIPGSAPGFEESPGPLGVRSLVPENNSHSVGHTRAPSADDVARSEKPQPELAKRYRRRSWGNIDNTGLINLQLHLPASSPIPMPKGTDYFDQDRPRSAQSQKEVAGSIHSARSSTSSVHDPSVPPKTVPKSDDIKRIPKPSPLSQPVSADSTSPATAQPNPQNQQPKPAMSPASQRLAELTKNDAHRPGKSRLRRAFSFGSASELLKASQNNHRKDGLSVDKSRRELLKEELGAEQAAIAEQQEASGLGESIYSHHQGRFFNSSTDNLSISSTASSASIMLRKMGKGMKRSTRSLVGLFRPKSAIISPVDEMTAEPMAPQLSVVNIEAERKSVAANADPQDVPHGGTVFPKMESTVPPASTQDDDLTEAAQSRKSIVGGDRERAEVLAAVRKGILKKTNSESTFSTPPKPASQNENGTDSPNSSAPSTPEDQPRTGYRRSDVVKIAGEDELSDTKNVSLGPQSVSSKSLVFSPRIQFHETWPSGEYDRRGDIATCNRLTPLLAQQIKEELNTFKMEMEVHETSKIYTHFL
ncbi:hypothetical protein ASPCAL09212 [Aspergillus calidoustus]|uniref:Protein BNI4 n=1 Tax=Aspergillus calidoustus TaxID=454130 RepID=A0A0U5GYH1_ASPCI|nr:hypothetical protein ASPCAL09212 [Aspergillus calidoustus]